MKYAATYQLKQLQEAEEKVEWYLKNLTRCIFIDYLSYETVDAFALIDIVKNLFELQQRKTEFRNRISAIEIGIEEFLRQVKAE